VQVVVGADPVEPSRDPAAALGLAAPDHRRGLAVRPGRQVTDVHARRQGDPPRGGDLGPPLRVLPGPVVRREDLVVTGAAGRPQLARAEDRRAREEPQRDAVPVALLPQAALPAAGVRGDVGGQRDAPGPDRPGQLDRLGHRVAVPEHQVAALGPERFTQIGQGLVQEARPIRRQPLQPRVEDEERDHLLGVGARVRQRRIVVHPQVPSQQDDGRPHQAAAGTGVPGLVSSERTATATRRLFGTVARRVKTS